MTENAAYFYVAVEIRKGQSIGTLIRCATAFGARALIIIGSKSFSTHGSHGSHRRLKIIHYYYWSELMEQMKVRDPSIRIIGISPSAPLTVEHNFQTTDSISHTSNCCFIVPDLKMGFTDEQRAFCDSYVYVKVPNQNREMLLHWNTKVSLALQSFASTKGLIQTAYHGNKYDVVERLDAGKTWFENELPGSSDPIDAIDTEDFEDTSASIGSLFSFWGQDEDES